MTDNQKNEMKKLLVSLALLAVFPAIVIATNLMVDPANIFNTKYAKRAASIMADGHNVTNIRNMDDRELLRQYASMTDKKISTLVLGSSRTMQYTTDVTGDENSFCASVTGADLRDMVGGYVLFKNSGQSPDTVIFGAEYWFLSPTNFDSRAIVEEYEQFCAETGNEPYKTASRKRAMIKEFFSFSYFQSSVRHLFKHDMPDLAQTDSADNRYPTRRADGTYSYEQEYRTRDVETVRDEVIKTNHGNSIANDFTHLDDGLKKQLEDFITYMQADGVEVVIQLSPFHPDYYAYMLVHDSFAEILSTEEYFYSLGEKYGVSVYGGYNPDDFGMTYSDFYDSQHPSAIGAYKYYGISK